MMITRFLHRPVSVATLAYARILFGALALFSTIRFMALGWVEDHFINSMVQFKYYGFYWVKILPAWGMYALHIGMLLGALGIMLGAFYRILAPLFCLCFCYAELIDITYYLNHYYFFSLFGLLLCFLPAHRYCSLDVWRKPALQIKMVPRWTIALLQFQIFTVYFFAGIAKINSDWLLEALPLRIWLPAHDDLPLMGHLFKYPITAYVFSWAGMLFDTFVIFFLLWRPTRPWAYLAIVVFHSITGLLFQIGIFPIVMIALTTIYFGPEFHQKALAQILRRFGTYSKVPKAQIETMKTVAQGPKPWLTWVLGAYVAFQLLFPLRYLLYPGNIFWTEEGYRFAWRVMLMEKAGTATFYVKDQATGREGQVLNSDFLGEHQEKQMAMQPDLILQYAHFLADHYRKKGIKKPSVRAEVYVTLNGRASQLYFDPQLDLTKLTDDWTHKTWLSPAKPID
jgi:hypothetical protein